MMRGAWVCLSVCVLAMAGCIEFPLLRDSTEASKRGKRTEPVTAAEVSPINAHAIADALHDELERDAATLATTDKPTAK